MPQTANSAFDVLVVATAAIVTATIIIAVLFWVGQEWRELDRREPPAGPQ